MNISIYQNNEFTQTLSSSTESITRFISTLPSGTSYIDGLWNSKDHYILNGVGTNRPEFSLTITGAITTGIPAGTTITVKTPDYILTDYLVDDGTFDLTGSSYGEYQLEATNGVYKKLTVYVYV